MAKTAIYLNFKNNTEEAFRFYSTVFGVELSPIFRIGDAPKQEGQPELSDDMKSLIMNVSLKLPGGVDLHGTDAPEEMGFNLSVGDNVSIMIYPDSREHADTLFSALSEGGHVNAQMSDQFWGDYFGSCCDKFGIQWMFAYNPKNLE